MTVDRPSGGLGPLGRRLLVAFVLVSLTAVLVLAVAALVGAERGLSASQDSARRRAAEQTAAAAAAAYTSAGGWSGADLQAARAVAIAAGARQVVVTDVNGEVVGVSSGTGMMGGGMHMGGGVVVGGGGVSHEVMTGGHPVGAVRLVFGPSGSPGRDVAWSWIAAAAVAAVAVAVAVSWFVTRRLTEPLVRLTATTRAF
ncbi:MAG TPA: sensor histidine kinase, partial [Candidatus Eisenbacteria bacterium]|nr:sensor histidine kinase [Candidatus Eisenbacteria bacterium]